jgi:DNA-binding CsgD family transcriptional regulator
MLTGRDGEQQVIARLLAESRLGASGVLVVTGEPGVGKTSLLDQVLSELEGMRLLRATGIEAEQDIPFAGLLQLLRPALPAIDGIPAPQADALSAALALGDRRPDRVRSGADRFTIGAAVLGLVCRYAEDGPVAVVVDDLHLLDAPSAEALVFAARRLAADPVVVLATARSGEAEELVAGLPRMRLEGLDSESARALLRAAFGSTHSEEQLGVLHRLTGGNPLALLELGDAGGVEAMESAATGLPLRAPAAVTDAFARRLADLDEECLSALLVASVCGGDLRVTTDACAVLGVDGARLGDAEDRGLVAVHGDEVAFRHPLVRAAAYSRASVQDRHAAHGAVAGVLPPQDVDRRAWHLSEAVWHPDTAVSDLLAEAADNAVARTAFAVASSAFERSARLSPDAEARAERLLLAADTAWLAGQGPRALDLLDQHGRLGPAPGGSVRELGLRGTIAARTGSLRSALDLLTAAADRADDPDEEVVLLADAVHVTFYLGDARTATVLAARLAGLQPAVTTARARGLGLMSTGIAKVLAGQGGVDEIRAAVPVLEGTTELRQDPRRLSWLMLAPLFLRDTTGGLRLRAIVEEVRGAAGVGTMPSVLFHVARDQATTAAWVQAEASYAEAIRLARETGQTTELAMSLAGLCWLESRRGKDDDCRRHADEAQSICAERDIHVGEAWVSFALGDLELSLGRPEAAVAHLQRLATLLERHGLGDPDLAPGAELTDALLRTGHAEAARAVAAAYLAAATAKGQPWAVARAHRATAQVADDAGMDEGFRSALDWHARTLDRFEVARTALAYGERLRRAGRRVDARVQLRAALEEFDRLGALHWSERAAAELTATGETITRTAAGVATALTPQELQVSVLLAEGRTTREAAAALFLSPKTVEYHLRKVYAKLGIRSRDELAVVVADLAAPTQEHAEAARPHLDGGTTGPLGAGSAPSR